MSETAKHSRPGRPTWGRVLSKAIPALIVLAAIAGVVGVWLLPEKEDSKPAGGPPPVSVRAQAVEAIREMPDTFDLLGKVEANRVVDVSAEVAGRVEDIPVSEGRPIRKGTVMIRLNTDLLQAEYDRAKATAEFDRREYERMSRLQERGVATPAEVDQARAKADASRAGFEAARFRLDRTTIAAPISGTLDAVIPEVGMYVESGKIVARIVDIETAKVVVDVPERDVPFLRIGQEEEVFTKGRFASELTGKITFVGELGDEATNTTRVEISVDNRRRALRSQQIVRVRLRRGMLKNVIMIPLNAVIPLEQGQAVYVVDDNGRAQRRNVSVELEFIKGSKVRVRGELAEGDLLIVAGHRFVAPGQPVKVVSETGRRVPAARHASQPASRRVSPPEPRQ